MVKNVLTLFLFMSSLLLIFNSIFSIKTATENVARGLPTSQHGVNLELPAPEDITVTRGGQQWSGNKQTYNCTIHH